MLITELINELETILIEHNDMEVLINNKNTLDNIAGTSTANNDTETVTIIHI